MVILTDKGLNNKAESSLFGWQIVLNEMVRKAGSPALKWQLILTEKDPDNKAESPVFGCRLS